MGIIEACRFVQAEWYTVDLLRNQCENILNGWREITAFEGLHLLFAQLLSYVLLRYCLPGHGTQASDVDEIHL